MAVHSTSSHVANQKNETIKLRTEEATLFFKYLKTSRKLAERDLRHGGGKDTISTDTFLIKQSKTNQRINQLISQDVTLQRNAKLRIISQG